MNYRNILQRLDQLQADLCDLRLAVIDQLPRLPSEERLDQIVDDKPEPPQKKIKTRQPVEEIKAPPVEEEVAAILNNRQTQLRRVIAMGNKNGIFTDPDEDNLLN